MGGLLKAPNPRWSLGEPLAIMSDDPAQAQVSPMRAAGKQPIMIVGQVYIGNSGGEEHKHSFDD